MRVELLQEDIDNAEPIKCDRCVIARCLQRVTGKYVRVGWTHALLYDNYDAYLDDKNPVTVYLPDEATECIHAFDNRQKVEPFSFEIDYPLQSEDATCESATPSGG